MPSGNAVAALVLSRLARLTGSERFREAKELHLRFLSGAIWEYPAEYCFTLLTMLEELWPTAELVCATYAVPRELLDYLRREPHRNLTVVLKTPENAQQLAETATFTEAFPIPETGAKYYFCRGGTCQSPVDSLEALIRKSSVVW